MAKIEMKAADLGELYALLKMYQASYGEVPESLIKDIECRFKTTYTVCPTSKTPLSITNPRGAGRKSKIEPEEKEQIKQMRSSGMAIREIAAKTGYSTGYVHKLIHEHNGCGESGCKE